MKLILLFLVIEVFNFQITSAGKKHGIDKRKLITRRLRPRLPSIFKDNDNDNSLLYANDFAILKSIFS